MEKTGIIFPGMAELRSKMEAMKASSRQISRGNKTTSGPEGVLSKLLRGDQIKIDASEAESNVHQAG